MTAARRSTTIDDDRRAHIEVLAQAADRFDAQVLAYCLMGNHYHLVLHTRAANLSRFMRHLNGVYTQSFNRRHGLVGHLFQGRFKAILVDRDAYLLALCRYVERNPVAARLVDAAEDWPWSSCRAHLGLAPTPEWLDTDGLHGYLLARPVATAADRRRAVAGYTRLLRDDSVSKLWADGLRQQIFLGDEAFVERRLAAVPALQRTSPEVPRPQRSLPQSGLALRLQAGTSREESLHAAYTAGGRSMTELAREMGLSVSRVSRLIARFEAQRAAGCA